MIRPKTTVRRTSGGPEERDPVERGTEPDPDRTRLLGTPNRDSRGKGARGEKGQGGAAWPKKSSKRAAALLAERSVLQDGPERTVFFFFSAPP